VPPGPGEAVVIGGGRFGALAVRRLGPAVSLVVEPEPGPELAGLAAPVLRAEGVEAAAELLAATEPPRWIVPAAPIHLLARWLERDLNHLSPRPAALARESLPAVALVVGEDGGPWHLSLADFRCPDDCPEPAEACTVTGRPRGEPLHRRLAAAAPPGWRAGVLRSHQLAPGVGGLAGAEMLALRDSLAALGGRWLIATACRCHGVAEGLELEAAA
jgi:hypothetical protein